MFEVLQKSIYATVGLALMTREKAEAVGRKLAADAKLSEADGKNFVDDLLLRIDDTKATLEKLIGVQVDRTLERLNLPNRHEVDMLKERLEKLESAAASRKEQA